MKDPEVKVCGCFLFFWLAKDKGEPQRGSIQTHLVIFLMFGLGMCTTYNPVQIS